MKEWESPVGTLLLGEYDNKLCLLDWKYRTMRNAVDKRIQQGLKAEYKEKNVPLFDNVETQLLEYFHKQRKVFDIPLLTLGTPFQQKVWAALRSIPYGQTLSYSELAEKLGKKEAQRAVASANGANGISIIIPCHRIISKDGSLGGYAGGLKTKQKLLNLEAQPALFEPELLT